MTDDGPLLRRPTPDDAADVLSAFASHPDMARQGDVTTLAEAEGYLASLLSPESSHEPWAVVDGDRLVGLVCVTVDEANLSGWFWYWMHPDARGRGWMGRAAATVAEWALTDRGLGVLTTEVGYEAGGST